MIAALFVQREDTVLLCSPGAAWLEKETNVLTGEEIEVLKFDPKKLTILKGIANAKEKP